MREKITRNSRVCQTRLLTIKEAARRFGIHPRQISTCNPWPASPPYTRWAHVACTSEGCRVLARPIRRTRWEMDMVVRTFSHDGRAGKILDVSGDAGISSAHGVIVSDRTTTFPNSPPETRYDRQHEHAADAILLLERLRRANREHIYPSTSELTEERVFGLRPPNRINDLVRGKYNGMRYDVEKINCGHGIFRWRLHEPARPGYPKSKNQTILPLEQPTPPADWYEVQTGRPRAAAASSPSAENLPLFAGVRE
jgi:hypothetical protein